MYLEARYEEFMPAMDYLKNLGVRDSLRPNETKIQYFQTSVGLDQEINDDLKEAFRSGEGLEELEEYIEENLDLINELDTNIHIHGIIDELDENKTNEIEEKLLDFLPKSNYVVEIGEDKLLEEEPERFEAYLIIE